MSTNLSKIKRDKMLETISQIKENIDDDETLKNLSLIEYELTKKKYGLVWEEHEEKVDEELKTKIPTFEEVKDKEIVSNKDDKFNFLLEGDNLHSLYLLEKTHKGKIDVIYIDPPYNTGKKDFIYDDKYIDIEDGYKHSKWLSFMENRLTIAKNILKENGFIFISIDDNEVFQLKLLCDEIFGENNFISALSIENNPKGRKNSNFISVSNEYCLIYAKNKNVSYFVENVPKSSSDLAEDENGNYIHNSGKRVLVGENFFNKEVSDIDSDKHYSIYYNREKNEFKILKEQNISDVNTELIKNGFQRYISYRNNTFVENTYTKTKIMELFRNGALDFKNNKIYEKNFSTTIRLKSLVVNRKYEAVVDNQIVKDYQIDVKTTSAGTELKSIFGTTNIPFNNPKNVGLLKLLITLIDNKNATILDFFAGSGTTGQAVLELNNEDNGNRQFILCTNNENNICEDITYQRLKTVISGTRKDNTKYSDGINANLKYYKTTYVPRLNTDEENIQENLLFNIKNLIQLENGISVDDERIRVILDEDEIDIFSINDEDVKQCERLYISSDILLTAQQVKTFEDNNVEVFIIPEYYFDNEIKEVQ